MDGGYPRGLKGEEILLEARILAVADVMGLMASRRPYRPGLGIDKALEEKSSAMQGSSMARRPQPPACACSGRKAANYQPDATSLSLRRRAFSACYATRCSVSSVISF